MKLAHPRHLVTAEDVESGKPDPECYRLGKSRLGLSPAEDQDQEKVLVIEDAPAGVRAGKSAGCQVLAVATTHSIAQLEEAGADWIVRDLNSVRQVGTDLKSDGATVMEIWHPWTRHG